MKVTKKKIILILFFIILIAFIWYIHNKQKNSEISEKEKEKLLYTVTKWDIKTEVKVMATAKLANEQNLSFWQEWKITNVNVKIWDIVTVWEVLAELNLEQYDNSIESAFLELENAELWLNKLINNDTSVLESQLNLQINETQSNYNIELEQQTLLKKQLEVNLEQQKDLLEKMSRDYEIAQKNLEIQKSDLAISSELEIEQVQNSLSSREQTVNNVISSINSNLWDLKNQVRKVDKIFWVSYEFKNENDNYEHLLSAENKILKNQTKELISNSYLVIEKYENIIKEISIKNYTNEQISEAIQKFYLDTEIFVELFDTAIDAVENSIESLNVLTTTEIQWFNNILVWARINIVSSRNQLNSLSSSINSLLSWENQKKELEITLKQKQVDFDMQKSLFEKQKKDLLNQAKSYDNLKQDNKNNLIKQQNKINNIIEKIDVLKKELRDIKDWADQYDIKQQKNLIQQAKLKIERIQDNKDDYQIIAEFDGRVRSIDIVEWEQYKLDDNNFIVIENPDLIELELQVNQIDIVKIKENDPVIVTFDSYPNTPIEAKITTRNVNPEPNWRWGIYYEATILLEKQNLEILAWMSAIVKILTSKADDVLVIPSLSLSYEKDKKFVYIKNNEEYKKHEIKTWIINNFQAEVIEWLENWDIIKASILDEKTLIEMWIDEQSNSPFWN